MKKLITRTLLAVVLCFGHAPVLRAEEAPAEPVNILISEIQTGGTTAASQEFVELYNPNSEPVAVTGWQLQYRSASATALQSWPASTAKATITCSAPDCEVNIPAMGRLLLTANMPDLSNALPMSGGFSDKGGQIRLVAPQENAAAIVHDLVGYGTSVYSEGNAPAAAPLAGKSLKRITSQDGVLIDTNNNSADFISNCGNPTPGSADTTTLPLAGGCHTPDTQTDETDPDTQPEETEEQPNTPVSFPPVIITEALPDPGPPQQDSADEFIEVYNPNDIAVNLKDYRLQTGSDFRYSYLLGDTPLKPHEYLAIFSTVSHLGLSNSGSGVRLKDPEGNIVYEMPAYPSAKEGQSWMQDETGWHWTLTPTPSALNILTQPAPKMPAATTTPKKKTSKPPASKKATAPKAPKAQTAKKPVTKQEEKKPPSQVASANSNAGHYWLLFPIGALAAGYAAYEYRQDIAKATRKGWTKVTGQRNKTGSQDKN